MFGIYDECALYRLYTFLVINYQTLKALSYLQQHKKVSTTWSCTSYNER